MIAKLLASAAALKGILVGAAEDLQDRVEKTTRRVIKTSIVYVVMIVAGIFVLVGLAQFLEEVFQWMNGVGLLVVGGALILLALLAAAMR